MAMQGKLWWGQVRFGEAWYGQVWQGREVSQWLHCGSSPWGRPINLMRRGSVRLGWVWHGEVGWGMAWPYLVKAG